MQHNSGYTLWEILICLAIVALLGIAVYPPIANMMERQATTIAINRMVAAIKLSRHSAMQYRTTATLCALKTDQTCGADWSGELTIFLDKNQDARQGESDATVRKIPPLTSGASIKWRAFRNRQYLQMTTYGLTNYQNGNFVACPSSGNTRWAKQLVLNTQGRVRRGHRINDAGYPEDRRGRILRC